MLRFKCDFTKFDYFCANFLGSAYINPKLFFYFSAIDIEPEISLEIESKYVPGSNASNPKEKFEGKVSKRLSYFRDLSKKFIKKWYIFTVGFPIEIDRRSMNLRSSLWETL